MCQAEKLRRWPGPYNSGIENPNAPDVLCRAPHGSRVHDGSRFWLETTVVRVRGIWLRTCALRCQGSIADFQGMEHLRCLRCGREIEPGSKSVAVYMFAQTVGIRPRQKSAAQRICFCPQCSVSLAMGPAPEGALNVAAWEMLRDLVSSDPALNEAAWDNLRGVAGLLPATGTDGRSRREPGSGYFEF